MAFPVACDLSDLVELDRDLLHVWVAGPGTGETIVLALPGRGWVLIDGCRTAIDAGGEFLPARHLFHRYKGMDDPVELMVLTHPHADHADGFGELVGELQPLRVGVASPPSGVTPALLRAYDLANEARLVDAEQDRRQGQVAAAMRAIEVWARTPGRAPLALSDGCELTVGEVHLRVRAPTAEQLERRLIGATPGDLGRIANAMSLVFEVEYGDLDLLLGGDLPVTHGGSVVAEGWNSVLERHPHLAPASRLKVPHHGSREALHPDLLALREPGCWWVTPFASQRLPRGQEHEAHEVIEGMARMLRRQERVQVTSLPTRRSQQRHLPPPGEVGQAEWNEAFQAKDLGGVFAARAVEIGPPAAATPSEAIWCGAFDRNGAWRGRWRGPIAMDVVRS